MKIASGRSRSSNSQSTHLYTDGRMGQRPLTTERATERRQQLLQAALEIFAENDYDDVSVDEIAESAGVSHGLIFQYFGTKKELYVATVEPLIEEFRARIAPDRSLPPPERLRTSLRAYAETISAHPRGYRFLMTSGIGFKEVREKVDAARLSAVGRIAPQMGLDPARPEVRAGIVGWIAYLDAAMLAWLDTGEPEVDVLVELIASALRGTGEAIAAASG
jgi:AcrR family transcriptional regulator